MPETQNAFLFPSPAQQTIPQRRYSYNFYNKPAEQDAVPSTKASLTVGESGQDDAFFESFLALLCQAVNRTDNGEQPSSVLDLRFSAEHGQTREEYTASLPLGGDKLLFSKSIWDLMVSLKDDLERKGVDVNALSEEVDGVLDELGAGVLSDWDSKAIDAMLSKLRGRYATILGSDGPRNIDIKVSVSDYLKFGLEASLKGGFNTAPEKNQEEADDPEAINGYVPPAMNDWLGEKTAPVQEQEKENEQSLDQNQVQPWTVSRMYSYLKPDVSKETLAGKDTVRTEEGRSAKYADHTSSQRSGNVGAASLPLLGAELREGLTNDFRGSREERREESVSDGPKDDKNPGANAKNTAARSTPSEEARSLDKNLEPKVKTNYTEHKTAFEQFFDGVMARRGNSGSDAVNTPGLELAKGSPFNQGEALRDGLNNVVRFIRASGEQKAVVTVDPPALGRVSVELVSSANGLEASIKVSSEQVRQLIQDHLAQLKLSLEQQGVQLTHFSVDVQQDNEHKGRSQGDTRRKAAGNAGEEDGPEDESLFRVDLNQGFLYWVA